MQTFLEKLAEELYTKHKNEFETTCLVFPTRRASLYFKKALSGHVTSPLWLPEIFSITDFMSKFSNVIIPDDITLVFELYEVYKKYFPYESFTHFYPYGVLLLNDFDDADRNLCNTTALFTNVKNVKEIEQQFNFGEEETELIHHFWKTYYNSEPGNLKKSFMKTWQHLADIYTDFKTVLLSKNRAYAGLAYRLCCETTNTAIHKQYSKIIFAGFYRLSKSEEKIIFDFKKQNKADIYWDADSYYVNDIKKEAGIFFRKNKLIDHTINWTGNYFSEIKKDISVYGISQSTGMAKSIGEKIEKLISDSIYTADEIAIVLPDEKALFPILYSLPANVEKINVTMGYPLSATSLHQLVMALKALLKSYLQNKNGEFVYFHQQVMDVLKHPLLHHLTKNNFLFFKNYLDNNTIIFKANDIISAFPNKIFTLIFTLPSSPNATLLWLQTIIEAVAKSNESDKNYFTKLEFAFFSKYYNTLQQLIDLLQKAAVQPEQDAFWMLMNDVVSTVRVPFNGEPLEGLQIMGFLETRLLDYKCIFLLDVNEDVLPPSAHKPSFIPFTLRKAFGMTTYEDSNAVNAYHFYRLMQRAEKVFLYYKLPQDKAVGRVEKSRYIYQIENELNGKGFAITFNEQTLSMPTLTQKEKPILIQKDTGVMQALSKFVSTDIEKNPASNFSASSLNNYIACKLKFYFEKVAGLKEPEKISEEMDAKDIGKVFHFCMQILYEKNKTYLATDINKMNDRIDATINIALKTILQIDVNEKSGMIILQEEIIKSYIHKVLSEDAKDTPFTISDLEVEKNKPIILGNTSRVFIKGIIDRIDKTTHDYRILDYKTGTVKFIKFESLDDLTNDKKYKEQFQMYLYFYMQSDKNQFKNYRTGLYTLKNMVKGIQYINDNVSLTTSDYDEFEKVLKQLLAEILNPDVPFSQTEDLKTCEYCAFKNICKR